MALIEINKNPSKKDLRWFGLLLALFFGILGLVAMLRFDAPPVARGLWIAGGGLALLYYAIPPLRRWMFVGWMVAAFPIGWTISHVLLGVVYYVVMTPIGLVMRLLGRDPLERRFDRDARTYWVEHRPDGEPARYFRQF